MTVRAEFDGAEAKQTHENAGFSVRWMTLAQAEKSAFVAQWDNLAAAASEANAFYESWFLLPSLREFGRDIPLFAVFSGEELIGLLPVSRELRYGRWPVPNIQNWMHPNMFLGAPLVRSGYELPFWQALFLKMDAQPGLGLFLHIHCLPVDGTLAKAMHIVADADERHHALVHLQERAFLQSGKSAEEYYLETMRGKKRKELRRQRKRLGELGNIVFSRSDGKTGLNRWCDEFLVLESKGWKGKEGSALDCTENTRCLLYDVLRGAAAQGRLELLDLRLDGRPLAMLVNFLTPPGSFSFKTSFDEDYRQYSPGVLLQIGNLGLLERTGISWCDSCAAEGHPMIDSIWAQRRNVGRYSIAIGGAARRAIFDCYLNGELMRSGKRGELPGKENRR